MTISFSSVDNAASTAANDVGRPTDKGINRCGNSTLFLSGKSGSTFV
jgi:hypothetical protein